MRFDPEDMNIQIVEAIEMASEMNASHDFALSISISGDYPSRARSDVGTQYTGGQTARLQAAPH